MDSLNQRNVLVFGGGAMATDFHVPRALNLLGAGRLDLVESNADRRTTLASLYAGEPKVEVLAKLPRERSYQLAVVAVPPAFHAAVVAECTSQIRQVLVEKPLCLTVADGRQVLQDCQRHGVQGFVCLPRRALKHLTILRSLIARGNFGSLRSVVINEGRPFGWKAASYAYFLKEQSGGGVLMDLAPHVFDQLFQLFDHLRLIDCFIDCEPGAIEANCSVSLLADQVTPIKVWLSRNRYLSNTIMIDFAEARCIASLHEEQLLVQPSSGSPYRIGPVGARVGFEEALDRLYLDKLAQGDNLGFSPAESLRSLGLIEEAYAAAVPFSPEECF